MMVHALILVIDRNGLLRLKSNRNQIWVIFLVSIENGNEAILKIKYKFISTYVMHICITKFNFFRRY